MMKYLLKVIKANLVFGGRPPRKPVTMVDDGRGGKETWLGALRRKTKGPQGTVEIPDR
jgi:hypothetical protein